MSNIDQARALARGSHQRMLVEGQACLKGRDLSGRAALYSTRYKASAQNLVLRLKAAGILFYEDRKRLRKGGRSQATCLAHVLVFPD